LRVFDVLTPALASSELATLGIAVAPNDLSLVRRDVKWIAQLPGDRAAWFAASDEPGSAKRIGAEIGNILADLHSNVEAAAAAGWLPHEPGLARASRLD
jgi:hypothetical protein